MAAIKKQSLVDQIYQRLRENIITMQLPLGSHLNVNELQSQMGVSCRRDWWYMKTMWAPGSLC